MLEKLAGIACRRLYTPCEILEDVLVEFDGPRVARIGRAGSGCPPPDVYDARSEDLTTTPGFVDVHLHGCGGADFLDNTQEAFETISRTSVRGGATSVVATTTLDADDHKLEKFASFVNNIRAATPSGARFLGIHMEGPFLNVEKRGGYGSAYVQPVDLDMARRMLELCGDLLLKITVAPEVPGGEELIEMLEQYPGGEFEIALGHTAVSYELARRCFARGRVRQVTHLFNAMPPIHHRAPGLITAALLDEGVTVEIIPDGHHLAPAIVELAYRLKGTSRTIVMTDGTPVTGMPQGTRIENLGAVTELRDDAIFLPDGTLAGSNLLMADALRKVQLLAHAPFEHALEMCTITPARSVKKGHLVGSVEPGKLADLCVLRSDSTVAAVIRDGMLAYAA